MGNSKKKYIKYFFLITSFYIKKSFRLERKPRQGLLIATTYLLVV